jgi:glycosyltransferase involved in cell wall biosynthesis
VSEICLSVAMCTYNGARFIREQLESIAAQSQVPNELVVCDDCSGDGSLEVIEDFSRHAPFPVRLIKNETNLGSRKNFEKAIGLCRGQIIALADQDDIWKPHKLERLYSTLRENPMAGYAFSDADLIDEEGKVLRRGLWEAIRFKGTLEEGFTPGEQVAAQLKRGIVTGATMAFRSSLKELVLPVSAYLVHDYWIALLASCIGACGIPIGESLILYRQHPGQQIGTKRKSVVEKLRWIREKAAEEYAGMARGYTDVGERLSSTPAGTLAIDPKYRVLVEEKIGHCGKRASAHDLRGMTKLREVFLEVLTGRYQRFSNSWQSVAEDLCP